MNKVSCAPQSEILVLTHPPPFPCPLLTLRDDVLDGPPGLLRHEADDGEHHEAGEHGGAAVDERHDQRVAVAVVLEPVVGGHGENASPGWAHRVEDLGGGVSPYLSR